MRVDLIINNIGKLVTMRGKNSPRIQSEMQDLEIIENAYIAISDGKIVEIGKGNGYEKIIEEYTSIESANGLLVTPGLIDSHTHLVHGGSREN